MSDMTFASEGEYVDAWCRFGYVHEDHRMSQGLTVGTRHYARFCHTCEVGMTHAWMTMQPAAVLDQVRASDRERRRGVAV